MYNVKNDHCGYCGGLFLDGNFPKTCLICKNISYLNPLPVSVILIPCLYNPSDPVGILIVRRSIQPKMGEWALPGGFIELGETWQQGSVREVKEEIGLDIDISSIDLLDVQTADNGNILIFSYYMRPVIWNDIKFITNREVSEIKISYGLEDLAFPTHRNVIEKYFLNL